MGNRLPGSADAKSIKKIGFFHFATTEDDPIDSLKASLAKTSKCEYLDDCLIVLPEALNLRGKYCGEAVIRPDPEVKNRLKRLSCERKVAVLVGLIDEIDDRELGYSSAYLIDGDVCACLSRKTRPDWPGSLPRYSVYAEPSDHAVLHRGICVAALICLDASPDPLPSNDIGRKSAELRGIKERHDSLIDRMSTCEKTPSILCIPSRMGTTSSDLVAQHWLQRVKVVIVANACSQRSVIQLNGGQPTHSTGIGNEVCIRDLMSPEMST